MKFLALILDDQASEVRLLTSVLQLRGMDVVSATDCESAATLLERSCPHLLLVDITLGEKANGLDWLQKVRSGPFRNLPAIISTSSAERANVEKAIRLGIDDYILKPADFNALSKKLFAIEQRLIEQPPYAFHAGPEDRSLPPSVQVSSRALISGISEVGFLLSSSLSNRKRLDDVEVETPLFEHAGVAAPRSISMLNRERETQSKLGVPFRVFCEAKGWKEEDRKQIRAWITKNRLTRAL